MTILHGILDNMEPLFLNLQYILISPMNHKNENMGLVFFLMKNIFVVATAAAVVVSYVSIDRLNLSLSHPK